MEENKMDGQTTEKTRYSDEEVEESRRSSGDMLEKAKA